VNFFHEVLMLVIDWLQVVQVVVIAIVGS